MRARGTLGCPIDDDADDTGSSLRPGLYCLDHDRRVVIPIEFTVADDANLVVPLLDTSTPSMTRGSYGIRVPQ